MSVTPHDIGKRVQTDQGLEGWMFSHSMAPVAGIVCDDGETCYWRVDKTTLARQLTDTPRVPMEVALTKRNARDALAVRAANLARALYAIPERLSRAMVLSPYDLADALVDLAEPDWEDKA